MPLLSDNPYLAASLALNLLNIVLLTVVFWRFRSYQKRQNELVQGEEIPDLAEIVLKHKKTLATHNKNLKELGKILEELVENNRLNIQRAGVVRFNPFAETGGNMSFAIALLDGKNNGIVISSLHGREGTRVYAKSVAGGKSQSRLTEEEEQAIRQANNL
ncbi:MAG: DUF4446 family protein [Candidatus Doudnabacteria bacterium]|nr:DUF4446 family protein [bacterium]MDZ4243893.1 DUF4446 family protein [Candidatus Doudnabacteria bacterium]